MIQCTKRNKTQRNTTTKLKSRDPTFLCSGTKRRKVNIFSLRRASNPSNQMSSVRLKEFRARQHLGQLVLPSPCCSRHSVDSLTTNTTKYILNRHTKVETLCFSNLSLNIWFFFFLSSHVPPHPVMLEPNMGWSRHGGVGGAVHFTSHAAHGNNRRLQLKKGT